MTSMEREQRAEVVLCQLVELMMKRETVDKSMISRRETIEWDWNCGLSLYIAAYCMFALFHQKQITKQNKQNNNKKPRTLHVSVCVFVCVCVCLFVCMCVCVCVCVCARAQ